MIVSPKLFEGNGGREGQGEAHESGLVGVRIGLRAGMYGCPRLQGQRSRATLLICCARTEGKLVRGYKRGVPAEQGSLRLVLRFRLLAMAHDHPGRVYKP